MHPYIKELYQKPSDDLSLDEAAIRYYADRISRGHEGLADDLRRWLMQLNPKKLKGPALSEWANEVVKAQQHDLR